MYYLKWWAVWVVKIRSLCMCYLKGCISLRVIISRVCALYLHTSCFCFKIQRFYCLGCIPHHKFTTYADTFSLNRNPDSYTEGPELAPQAETFPVSCGCSPIFRLRPFFSRFLAQKMCRAKNCAPAVLQASHGPKSFAAPRELSETLSEWLDRLSVIYLFSFHEARVPLWKVIFSIKLFIDRFISRWIFESRKANWQWLKDI